MVNLGTRAGFGLGPGPRFGPTWSQHAFGIKKAHEMDAERRRSHLAFIVALKLDAAHKARAAAAAAAAAEAEAKPRREEYERWDRKAAVRKMNKMTPRKFRLRYRVSQATFDMILDAIEDDLEPASRAKPGGCIGGPILAQLKLGATLRYLAGSNNIDCSDSHAMCEASFFKHRWSRRYRSTSITPCTSRRRQRNSLMQSGSCLIHGDTT
mmetsp:Transcript_28925/g.72600  ORF Transcript_28925/g.72600 Transcript_28925/m.72600 type:complete len:210 (-) Transcript_28925:330-959(-)